MHIQLNDQLTEIAADDTLAAVIDRLGLGERRIAVEINGEIVPYSQYPSYRLAQNDQVEIVHAIGGG